MDKYKIKIYKAAKSDLTDIIDYLNTLLPQASIRIYDNIIDKISSLDEMPECCPLLKDTQLRLKGYRSLIVDNYVVFYIIKGDTVQIRRILYGKRNYEQLL